jgi:hypothetical protein
MDHLGAEAIANRAFTPSRADGVLYFGRTGGGHKMETERGADTAAFSADELSLLV